MDDMAACYRRFLQGDEEGLCRIIQAYKDGLMLYLNGYVRDLALAEELTEETFVKLVLRRPRFSGRSTLKTWLYAIGRNIAVDHLRRRRNKERSLEECRELADEAVSLENGYLKQERKIRLHKAMEKLKPEYRQILWLVYFEGFSNKEVAGILGKTTHNVETTAWRARQALKQELQKEGFIYEEL